MKLSNIFCGYLASSSFNNNSIEEGSRRISVGDELLREIGSSFLRDSPSELRILSLLLGNNHKPSPHLNNLFSLLFEQSLLNSQYDYDQSEYVVTGNGTRVAVRNTPLTTSTSSFSDYLNAIDSGVLHLPRQSQLLTFQGVTNPRTNKPILFHHVYFDSTWSFQSMIHLKWDTITQLTTFLFVSLPWYRIVPVGLDTLELRFDPHSATDSTRLSYRTALNPIAEYDRYNQFIRQLSAITLTRQLILSGLKSEKKNHAMLIMQHFCKNSHLKSLHLKSTVSFPTAISLLESAGKYCILEELSIQSQNVVEMVTSAVNISILNSLHTLYIDFGYKLSVIDDLSMKELSGISRLKRLELVNVACGEPLVNYLIWNSKKSLLELKITGDYYEKSLISGMLMINVKRVALSKLDMANLPSTTTSSSSSLIEYLSVDELYSRDTCSLSLLQSLRHLRVGKVKEEGNSQQLFWKCVQSIATLDTIELDSFNIQLPTLDKSHSKIKNIIIERVKSSHLETVKHYLTHLFPNANLLQIRQIPQSKTTLSEIKNIFPTATLRYHGSHYSLNLIN